MTSCVIGKSFPCCGISDHSLCRGRVTQTSRPLIVGKVAEDRAIDGVFCKYIARKAANAHVVSLSVGVGSYNPNQDDYFDAVSIKSGNIDKQYNFETQSVPDGGASMTMLLMSFGGGMALRCRRAAK